MATSKLTTLPVPFDAPEQTRQFLDNQLRQVTTYLNDATQASEDETISGDWTFSGAASFDGAVDFTSTVDLSSATISGLSSDDLSDVASIAMLDEAETVTGAWTHNGDVTLGSAADLRLNNTNDVGLATTDHAFQIGSSSGLNIRMDNNELMAVSNGSAADLQLNADGGTVQVNTNTAGGLNVNRGAQLRLYDSNNTQYLRMNHTGSNGDIRCSNGGISVLPNGASTTRLNIQSTVVDVRGGARWRAFDSTNTSYQDAQVTTNAKSPSYTNYICDASAGGNLFMQAASISDDATATFAVPSYYIAVIVSTYNREAMGMFAGTTTQAPVDLGSGSLMNYGSANPDIDNSVNIWTSASGEFSIKNRLGSTRSFYVLILGNT